MEVFFDQDVVFESLPQALVFIDQVILKIISITRKQSPRTKVSSEFFIDTVSYDEAVKLFFIAMLESSIAVICEVPIFEELLFFRFKFLQLFIELFLDIELLVLGIIVCGCPTDAF